jgi:hypothetical protein
MQYDRRGLAVTSDSDRAVASFDDAVRSFLAHRSDASDHVAAALRHDPDLVVAHCFTGFALLLLGRGELFAPARAAAERAWRAMEQRGATDRERYLFSALQLWLDGEMEGAAAMLEATLAKQPLDAFTFKLLHALHFILGDAAAMRRVAASAGIAWRHDVPEFGFILGCCAFALEETGALVAAERCGRYAVAIENEDVWAIHAVAHAYETWKRPEAGLAWLRGRAPSLAGVNNFAGHLHWHEALFHLALGDSAAALALYDAKVRPARTDDYRDISNAGSLLWRLARAGCDVGARWDELADLAARRIDDRALVFAQLNYLLCLVGAGRDTAAAALLRHMRRWAEDDGTQARRAAAIGVPLAQSLLRQPNGNKVGRLFSIAELSLIGGSHAQRATFALILDQAKPARPHHSPSLPACGCERERAGEVGVSGKHHLTLPPLKRRAPRRSALRGSTPPLRGGEGLASIP